MVLPTQRYLVTVHRLVAIEIPVSASTELEAEERALEALEDDAQAGTEVDFSVDVADVEQLEHVTIEESYEDLGFVVEGSEDY